MEVIDPLAQALNRYRNSKTAEHIHLCAVQEAMAEVIYEQGLQPSATAYFAAAMAALEKEDASTTQSTPARAAMLSLLALALPKVPTSILRSKMEAALRIVLRVLESDQAEDSETSSGAARAGLQCLQLLLQAADTGNWPGFAPGFGVLLSYATDPRPKVRKRAQLCLVEVFSSLHNSSSLAPASDAFVSLCEKTMAAAMGKKGPESSKKVPEAATRAAVASLHMLGALRQILPLLSSSACARAMARLVEILALRQPMASRQALDCLLALFRSTAAVPRNGLAEVLAALVGEDGGGGEAGGRCYLGKESGEVRGRVEVMQKGVEKMYEVDPRMCAQKLPGVVRALVEHLASEQEEVVYVTADALRALIGSCIDNRMVQEGLTNQGLTAGLRGKAGPTPIERICSVIESSLGYQYSTAWDMCLLLVAALFDQLGPASHALMANTVVTLGRLQDLSDSEMKCRKQLHAALGAAIAAMGPDRFLSLLPLEMDGSDLSTSRVWLLPVLRQYIMGAKLSYFSDGVLPLAGRLKERAKKALDDERPVAAKNAEACVVALWSLLPAVANYAEDTSEGFQSLAKTLGDAIQKDPELRPIACQCLQTLIKQNLRAAGRRISPSGQKKKWEKQIAGEGQEEEEEEADLSPAEEKARQKLTEDVAKKNLEAISAYSRNFLPLLFNAFMVEKPEKRSELQATIAAFTSIAEPSVVKPFFVSIMQKLLQATQDQSGAATSAMAVDGANENAAISRRCTFMDLAISMAPGLDSESLQMIYVAAKPAIQDGDSGVQKRAYKLLAKLCEVYDGFVANNSDDLLEELMAGLTSCHSSAKRHRLYCLREIIAHILQAGDSRQEEAVAALLSEIMLATKESNKKARNAAYDLLIEIPRAMERNESGMESGGALFRFFSMVSAGLGGTTPHMVSASVVSLARLLYEYSVDLIHTVPELLPTALLLLRSKSREVIKAVLGLVKVVIARLPGAELESHVASILEGILLWCNDSKNHFKMKVRVILERLVRRCGYDLVARNIPEEHKKLLTHIRKTKEREQRKKRQGMSEAGDEDQKSTAGKSRASTARKSQWDHSEVFSDDDSLGGSDSDGEFASTKANTVGNASKGYSKNISAASARSMKNRKLNTRLPEDDPLAEVEPLDLLDVNRTRSVLSAPQSKRKKRDEEEDEEEYETEDGKLVITEENEKWTKKRKNDNDDEEEDEEAISRRRQLKKLNRKNQSSNDVNKRKGLLTKGVKKPKGWAYTGEEYAAKKGKARGDTKKQGKLEPHAYWPLDPKMLNRRETKKSEARSGMASVLKIGKKLSSLNVNKALKARGGVKKTTKSHKGKGKGKGVNRR